MQNVSRKNSAPGKDGIKYNVFKNMNVENQLCILKFFNKIWSKSIVIPIPKTNNVSTPNDTRPINLIKSRPKLLDKMINARLIFRNGYCMSDEVFTDIGVPQGSPLS